MDTDLRERVNEHQRKLEARGVRDIKLCLDPTIKFDVDKVARDLCDILDAIEQGRTKLMEPLGDSYDPENRYEMDSSEKLRWKNV